MLKIPRGEVGDVSFRASVSQVVGNKHDGLAPLLPCRSVPSQLACLWCAACSDREAIRVTREGNEGFESRSRKGSGVALISNPFRLTNQHFIISRIQECATPLFGDGISGDEPGPAEAPFAPAMQGAIRGPRKEGEPWHPSVITKTSDAAMETLRALLLEQVEDALF